MSQVTTIQITVTADDEQEHFRIAMDSAGTGKGHLVAAAQIISTAMDHWEADVLGEIAVLMELSHLLTEIREQRPRTGGMTHGVH